ncbi:MAG: class I SAM-dependent methyltransferase [Planctomycetota bacterium]
MHKLSIAALIFVCAAALGACRQLAREPQSAGHTHDTPAERASTANRDKHADPDVQQYIARLQSEERVADLQIGVVVGKLALPADAVIGDLGCGPGLFAVAFAQACARGVVYASDIEPAQLDQVRQRLVRNDLRNVVPVLASADDPHFPPARLDVVFIGDTYHHLSDRVAYMRRLQSTLRPTGRLVVLEYKPGDLAVGPPADHKLPEGVMRRELSDAGYTLVEHFDTHPYHDFEIWRVLQAWEKAR